LYWIFTTKADIQRYHRIPIRQLPRQVGPRGVGNQSDLMLRVHAAVLFGGIHPEDEVVKFVKVDEGVAIL